MKFNTKLKSFVLSTMLLVFSAAQAQKANDLIGKWGFSDSPREIEIYFENSKYYGKITKISGEDSKEKAGHIMFKDLIYDPSENKYTGKMNAPSGMTASGELVLADRNKLKISVKKLFFSKSLTLKRIK
ncbi:DUF2147 domain-containing protein [Flavobacterium sp. ZT3R18]|uniref:DUF2147 domain-containing protein n=1 Tax=Flavobacterium sp. ZT3R18 TaxID=2594429 RepID=UPI00117BDCF2|nr:DUF2147 domain-containing protein [Flavobacterium sp. ZT3R18]TRX36990.1 DUF2147 domain-containing protein [Flavobacterium sp. ZT3R18]